MRLFASSMIVALGTLAAASATPVFAGAAPGPAAKSAIPDTSQVETVGRWGHRHHGFGGYGGFGGFGLYVGPRWDGYYGSPYYGYSDPYWDDDYYYAPRTYYYPRYRYRNWGHRHRGGHRHHRRYH
jgi:hypothetical protein